METANDDVLASAEDASNEIDVVRNGPGADPSDLPALPDYNFWFTILKATTEKLSIRAVYWIMCLGFPVVVAAVWIFVLMTTHYGDNFPLFFQIGAPIFVEGVTAWFMLVKLKGLKNYRKGGPER